MSLVKRRWTPAFAGVTNDHILLRSVTFIYKIVEHYAKKSEIYFNELSPHVMRSTAATKALDNNADITKVQEWLGHADISTTRIYDKRQSRPEDSPTNKVGY